MAYLLLIVIPLIVFAIWTLTHRERVARIEPTRHLWASARASSADGALVHLQAEVTIELADPAQAVSDSTITALAEDALRRVIVTGRVLSLPGIGDEVPLGDLASAPDIEAVTLVITAADVEITRELRRLVGGP